MTGTINSTDATGDSYISTDETALNAVYTGTEEIASVQWYMNGIAAVGATAKTPNLTVAHLGTVADGKTVYVKFTTTEGDEIRSDTFTFADPVATTVTDITAGTAFTSGTTALTITDQFGETYDPSGDTAPTVSCAAGNTGCTTGATIALDADGKMTLTAAGVAAGDIFSFTMADKTVTITTTGGTVNGTYSVA